MSVIRTERSCLQKAQALFLTDRSRVADRATSSESSVRHLQYEDHLDDHFHARSYRTRDENRYYHCHAIPNII